MTRIQLYSILPSCGSTRPLFKHETIVLNYQASESPDQVQTKSRLPKHCRRAVVSHIVTLHAFMVLITKYLQSLPTEHLKHEPISLLFFTRLFFLLEWD